MEHRKCWSKVYGKPDRGQSNCQLTVNYSTARILKWNILCTVLSKINPPPPFHTIYRQSTCKKGAFGWILIFLSCICPLDSSVPQYMQGQQSWQLLQLSGDSHLTLYNTWHIITWLEKVKLQLLGDSQLYNAFSIMSLFLPPQWWTLSLTQQATLWMKTMGLWHWLYERQDKVKSLSPWISLPPLVVLEVCTHVHTSEFPSPSHKSPILSRSPHLLFFLSLPFHLTSHPPHPTFSSHLPPSHSQTPLPL